MQFLVDIGGELWRVSLSCLPHFLVVVRCLRSIASGVQCFVYELKVSLSNWRWSIPIDGRLSKSSTKTSWSFWILLICVWKLWYGWMASDLRIVLRVRVISINIFHKHVNLTIWLTFVKCCGWSCVFSIYSLIIFGFHFLPSYIFCRVYKL